MNVQLTTTNKIGVHLPLIGLDIEADQPTGIGFARKRKPGWRQRLDQAAALSIGAGVVTVRRIMGEQNAAQAHMATAIRQRDALQARVELLEAELLYRPALPPVALIEAPPSKGVKRPRWTAAERTALGELLDKKKARKLTYALIADELAERFDRPFNARQVGDKARRMAASGTTAPKGRKQSAKRQARVRRAA